MKLYENSAEFCKATGIDSNQLANTYHKYNEGARQGKDEFGKQFFANVPYEMNDKVAVS